MSRRLSILHLAFEDPRRPGSGGGAVRTREIDARLAERHEVHVVTAGWPGARPREEDGVSWRQTPALPGRASALPYFAAAPFLARYAAADLVVEDFAAPVSTIGLPRFTARPTIGVVQWLFAREKAREYHLPVDRVETWGLRQHRTLIAVSAGLAEVLRCRAPRADVHVVENGLSSRGEPEPTTAHPLAPVTPHLVYLGRLEIAQKGLDVLLAALVEPELTGLREPVRLVVAGDGPDEAALRATAARLGLHDRVVWAGRVSGAAKRQLLAGAAAVVIPSRYETFGMVAAEAMAEGAAVVASDIPCLRDVVAGAGGVLVPPHDAAALAGALRSLLDDPARARELGRRGRSASDRYDWDRLAAAQEAVYLETVERRAREHS